MLWPKKGQLSVERFVPRYHGDLKHRSNHTNYTKPGHLKHKGRKHKLDENPNWKFKWPLEPLEPHMTRLKTITNLLRMELL